MKLLTSLFNLIFILSFVMASSIQFALAARSTIIEPNAKSDRSSNLMMKKNKNVKVSELVQLSENLLSPQEYEKLVKDSRQSRDITIEEIKHGENFFYLKSGNIKVVFNWVNKNNVAYKLNGHKFTFAEASNSKIWQNKVEKIIKGYSASDDTERNSSRQKSAALMLLPLFFQSNEAEAFNFNNKYLWIGVAAAAVALIANHYYKKHKKVHEGNKGEIAKRLANARKELAAAKARNETNLAPYVKKVEDLQTLLAEYNSSSNDVGFWGYAFGNRMSKPAMYDPQMPEDEGSTDTPSNNGTPGTPGAPTSPPGSTTRSLSTPGTYTDGAY